MAVNPFRQLDVIRIASQKGNIVRDCYRLMYSKELWMKANAKLVPNLGNLTKGTATIGVSLQRIEDIIEQLKTGTYRFSPVKRSYIPKLNLKKRFLGIYVEDKLVQEVMRMILENVYEPVFSDYSHGFRKGRSCHTALFQIKNTWKDLTWCMKGDIKGFFDCIDPSILIKLISKKINDHRFLLLIHNALTSGVMENWPFHEKFSGTPQGGAIASILANIYLHEFDLFMEKQIKEFDNGNFRAGSEGNIKLYSKIRDLSRRVKSQDERNGHKYWQGRQELILNIQELKEKQAKVPSVDPRGNNGQRERMTYVRYAGDFVVGIAGSKRSAAEMKEIIRYFLQKELHLELCDETTLIAHLEQPIPFLGYQFRRWNEGHVKGAGYQPNQHPFIKRPLSGVIKLEIPDRKIKEFARKNGYGNLENFKIIHRAKLLNSSEIQILYTYNTELRGFANYYKLACNYHHLNKLFYLAESSFIKTLANKRRSTSKKVAFSLRRHKQGVFCLVEKDKDGNDKLHHFVKLKDLPKTRK